MNSIGTQRYGTSGAAHPARVELERRPLDRRHASHGQAGTDGSRRWGGTPVLALALAIGATGLALISIATDDVAPAPAPARVVETIADSVEPNTTAVPAVPDGVPCLRPPIRGLVPC